MTGIRICGVGSYLPDNIVDNEAYTAFIETSDEWISSRTGIKTRHIADGETTWSMGEIAAKRAIAQAGIDPLEIDLILVTSVTSDYITPSLSCVIQNLVGAQNAVCFDLNCACAAFIYALDMAHRYIKCGDYKTVLIVSAEMLSRITNYEDRTTCVLFGDGAGACVVKAGDNLFAAHLGSDGSGMHLLFANNPPPSSPFTTKTPVENEISNMPWPTGKLFMDGKEVYKFATKMMPFSIEKACEKAGITTAELDWVVPHQANIRIIQTAMKNLHLPMEKAAVSIDHYGNTSSASIPILLDEMIGAGKLQRGQKIALSGFGAGLVYGGAVLEY